MIQIENSHYFLSEDNEIINSKSGKILKGSIHKKKGYHQIGLVIDGTQLNTLMHRIVAHCYLGLDLRDPKTHVDHIDNNPSNNSVENLRLCSHLENRNFHSKHQLPNYVSKANTKRVKQGFLYVYSRRTNGKTKNLKYSVNLDTILDFKKQYELINN
tara:strand:- start:31 stop:501 length:471 start_codon:yes stop_codon:yes gene_type:complete